MTNRAIVLCVSSPFETNLSRAEQAHMWKKFLDGGTQHSRAAMTLPYVIRRCEREGIAYRLDAVPGEGYFVQPIKEYLK